MIAIGAVLTLTASGIALAETAPGDHTSGPDHMQHAMPSGQQPMGPDHMRQMMGSGQPPMGAGHMQEMMRQRQGMMGGRADLHGAATTPTMPGQDAFGAIQEVVPSSKPTRKLIGRRSISKRCDSISST